MTGVDQTISADDRSRVLAYISINAYVSNTRSGGSSRPLRTAIFAAQVRESDYSMGLDLDGILDDGLRRLHSARTEDPSLVLCEITVLRITMVTSQDQFSFAVTPDRLMRLGELGVELHFDLIP